MKIHVSEHEMQLLIMGLESRVDLIDNQLIKDPGVVLLINRRKQVQKLLNELNTLSRRVVE